MSDLHARLKAAVEERLEVARAAPYGGCMHGWCGDACLRWQVANDPATVIRMCVVDLERLEEHLRVETNYGGPGSMVRVVCNCCGDPQDWPCQDMVWLARAYGVDGLASAGGGA